MPGSYQGSFGQEALEGWAAGIAFWRRELSTVFLYFDNDQAAYAAQNSSVMRQLLDSPSVITR